MITLYTRPNCPHCDNAKRWLTDNRLDFEAIDISDDDKLKERLRAVGAKSVPQVFYGKRLLVRGGYKGMIEIGAEAIRRRMRAYDVIELLLNKKPA